TDLYIQSAPGALETVLEALLNNVRKHTPKATATLTAWILSDTAKPWPQDAIVTLSGPKVVLSIADNGPGISTDIRLRLFEPIPRGKWESVRIGLWLSRMLVRAHGGDLWLDQTRRGASFSSVWLLASAPTQES